MSLGHVCKLVVIDDMLIEFLLTEFPFVIEFIEEAVGQFTILNISQISFV